MSVRIGLPVARHRKNDPGCFASVTLGSTLTAFLLAAVVRKVRRSR